MFVVDLNDLPCVDVYRFLWAPIVHIFSYVVSDLYPADDNFFARVIWILVLIEVLFAFIVIPAWKFVCIFQRWITVMGFLESLVFTLMLYLIVNSNFFACIRIFDQVNLALNLNTLH